MQPNDEGYWLVWAMCLINGKSRYCALLYNSFEEAKTVQPGNLLDMDKQKFFIRNNW